MPTNWAGNYKYSSREQIQARSIEEIQDLIRRNPNLKAVGSRHSFNGAADTSGPQISLPALNTIEIDPASATVTVGAAVRYGDLAPVLARSGYALHNLASLPHISVVGAVATATHGSGTLNGNLATAVVAMEFVAGTGEVVHLSRRDNPGVFEGTVVHLGALGIVTSVTLALEPAYDVAQRVYFDLPFAQLETNLEDIFSAGYSVSLFTEWQNSRATQVWIKRRVDPTCAPLPQGTFFGARPAAAPVHPLRFHPVEACTEQEDKPGAWFERLPHFRIEFTPSSGEELQSEYFVPLDRGYEAIRAIESLRDQITPHLFVTELRTIEADDLWMSMAYQRRSLAIHFTWKPEWPAVRSLLLQIESKLEPFSARPHWGKLFTTPPEHLHAAYPRLRDFQALMKQYDPESKFRNDFLGQHL
ncbi:MAG TPA: D-arabinono-1,4-lactone oxidase [Acidobacteriaceae bacterium]|nr:D-arabinono-1,4-lactone oxidase [Acidobacteriaceae bacterium]